MAFYADYARRGAQVGAGPRRGKRKRKSVVLRTTRAKSAQKGATHATRARSSAPRRSATGRVGQSPPPAATGHRRAASPESPKPEATAEAAAAAAPGTEAEQGTAGAKGSRHGCRGERTDATTTTTTTAARHHRNTTYRCRRCCRRRPAVCHAVVTDPPAFRTQALPERPRSRPRLHAGASSADWAHSAG